MSGIDCYIGVRQIEIWPHLLASHDQAPIHRVVLELDQVVGGDFVPLAYGRMRKAQGPADRRRSAEFGDDLFDVWLFHGAMLAPLTSR